MLKRILLSIVNLHFIYCRKQNCKFKRTLMFNGRKCQVIGNNLFYNIMSLILIHIVNLCQYNHAHIPYAHPALNALYGANIDVEPYLKNGTLLA